MPLRRVWLVLLLCVLLTPLFGKGQMTTSLGAGTSWYMSFSQYADSIPFRSSYMYNSEYGMGFHENAWELSAIIPFHYVSASPVYDGLSRREFFSLGIGLRFQYLIKRNFGWFAGGTIAYNWYKVDQAFLSFGMKTGPYWEFPVTQTVRIAVELPIGLDFRKDINGVTIGLACRISYDMQNQNTEESYAE